MVRDAVVGKPFETPLLAFAWDLCHECNYRCPYCKCSTSAHRYPQLPLSAWMPVWERMRERYGRCRVIVSGGEPSVYPSFVALVKALEPLHAVDVCTNLSWDLSALVGVVSPERVRFSPTFHPSQADFEVFFKKAVEARAYLPGGRVLYVAYPGQIAAMAERSRRFRDAGLVLVPQPLFGDGVALNTEEEKMMLEAADPCRDGRIAYQLQRVAPRGKLCGAGHTYVLVRADGRVDRCSQLRSGAMGSIFEGGFRLLPAPAPCERDYCPIEPHLIIPDGDGCPGHGAGGKGMQA